MLQTERNDIGVSVSYEKFLGSVQEDEQHAFLIWFTARDLQSRHCLLLARVLFGVFFRLFCFLKNGLLETIDDALCLQENRVCVTICSL